MNDRYLYPDDTGFYFKALHAFELFCLKLYFYILISFLYVFLLAYLIICLSLFIYFILDYVFNLI